MDFERYKNKMVAPQVSRLKDPEGWKAYQAEETRLADLFYEEALQDVGLKGHPKAGKAFELAWQEGHACGLREVHGWLLKLADLLLN